MNVLQPQSLKIFKQPKPSSTIEKKFVCGCGRSYMSYPALYRHIRQKHNGQMPPDTKVPKSEMSDLPIFPGRPNKPAKVIDNINETQSELELAYDDLIRLMGDKLDMISPFGHKLPLETIVTQVLEFTRDKDDKWLKEFTEEAKVFLEENREKELKMVNLDLHEEFYRLESAKPLKILAFYVLWLLKLIIKIELLPDLCLIFSKIWKVLDETRLSIQDLDNKLVWKKIMKECEEIWAQLSIFSKDKAVLNEFIQKCCLLLGRPFEGKTLD